MLQEYSTTLADWATDLVVRALVMLSILGNSLANFIPLQVWDQSFPSIAIAIPSVMSPIYFTIIYSWLEEA